MQKAHEIEGKKIYELTREMKEQFDYKFPAICGQYPKIVVSVIPLDTEENQILPDFSGILIKYDIRFDILPQWKVKDQTYEIYGGFEISDESVKLLLRSSNKNGVSLDGTEWRHLKKNYDSEKIVALEAEFEKWPICPKTEDIAEIWRPFSERLSPYMVWRNYYDTQHEKEMHCSITECMEPDKMPVYIGRAHV